MKAKQNSIIQYCYVHTKWGMHKAKILLQTRLDNEDYFIVEMLNKQFCNKTKTQTFKAKNIEIIKIND